jgi:hypothetical protein
MSVFERGVIDMPLRNKSLVVDLDNQAGRGAFGDFSIVKTVGASRIVFDAPYEEAGHATAKMTGIIDRVTGALDISVRRDGEDKFILIYKLECNPARPLF